MELVELAGTDLKVSPICLGTWQFNGGQQSGDKTWYAQSEEVSKSILDKALELGVNFVDTAEAYLNSEVVVGRLLEGRRKNVVLATKFGARLSDYTPEEIEKSVLNSLQNLKTDYIDLYQVHYPSYLSKNMVANYAELKRQQSLGRIRYLGVSNFGCKNLTDVADNQFNPVTNQLPLNLLWRSVEYEVLPRCAQKNINVLAYSPLQQGLLTGKFTKVEDVPEGRRRGRLFRGDSTKLSRHGGEGAEKQLFQAINDIRAVCEKAGVGMPQAALSWCLSQDQVKSVIVGASSPEQVVENVKLASLKQETVKKLSEVTDELKNFIGKNPDQWAPADQPRMQ